MSNRKFIFDVDGTLTPSRGKIVEEFRLWFTDFCINNDVYLVTGSDYPKTVEQLGEYLLRWPVTVYNCSGNDVWQKGVNIRTNPWTMPNTVQEFLQYRLQTSKFVLRAGQHFDVRPGSVNFSILGRGATLRERQLYRAWDLETGERNQLVEDFRRNFGEELEISAGGETGVDIYPRGFNKSQILDDFSKCDTILFFGDRLDEHGNDRPLSDRLLADGYRGAAYPVEDWRHTWQLLKDLT